MIDTNEFNETNSTNLNGVDGKQYIVVNVGVEQYGIDIKYVDNIVRSQRITRVPKSQPFYMGVINLRGDIVPVMCIRRKFGLEPTQHTANTRIIIVKLDAQSSVGLIVDEVKEIVTLEEASIEQPSFRTNNDKSSYISGIGKQENGLISLLNIVSVIEERENN